MLIKISNGNTKLGDIPNIASVENVIRVQGAK